MAEAFSSVYRKDFVNFPRPGRKPKKDGPHPYFDLCWDNYLPRSELKPSYDASKEIIIKQLIKRRLRSVYQVSYCKSDETEDGIQIDPKADEFLIQFTKLYSPKTHPVPKPPISFRKVFGYSRPEWYYTGLSTYQEDIGQEAYRFFKEDYDQGISRMHGPLRSRKKEDAVSRTCSMCRQF